MREVMKMKRIIALFFVMCFALSGCNVNVENETKVGKNIIVTVSPEEVVDAEYLQDVVNETIKKDTSHFGLMTETELLQMIEYMEENKYIIKSGEYELNQSWDFEDGEFILNNGQKEKVFVFEKKQTGDGGNLVTIDSVGTFEIPEGWSYINEDDIFYIVKEDNKEVYLKGIMYDSQNVFDEKRILGNAEFVKNIASETLSNSAIIGKNEYRIDNEIEERYFLDLYSSYGCVMFIAVSDDMSYDTLKDIAKTYKMRQE